MAISPLDLSISSNHSRGTAWPPCASGGHSDRFIGVLEFPKNNCWWLAADHQGTHAEQPAKTSGHNIFLPKLSSPGTDFTCQDAMVPSQELPEGSGGGRRSPAGCSSLPDHLLEMDSSERQTLTPAQLGTTTGGGGELQVGLIPGTCYRWHPATGNGLCGG